VASAFCAEALVGEKSIKATAAIAPRHPVPLVIIVPPHAMPDKI
jgi:hypothetical protein